MTALFFILYYISVRVKKTKKKHDKSNTRLNINTSKILAKFYIQQQKKEVKTTSIQNWFWSFTPKSNTDLWFKTWSTAVCFLLKFNKLKFTCDKQGHNYRLQSQIWMRHYLNNIKKIIMRRGSQLWSHFFGLILLVRNYATKKNYRFSDLSISRDWNVFKITLFQDSRYIISKWTSKRNWKIKFKYITSNELMGLHQQKRTKRTGLTYCCFITIFWNHNYKIAKSYSWWRQ